MHEQNPTVKLAKARFSQLQLLATSIGSSVAGAIEALVSAAAERGEIPDALDGVGIKRQGERVVLTIAGHPLPALTIAEARTLASRLGGFSARTIEGSSTTHTLKGGTEIVIRRVGRAFSITSASARVVISASMAGDVIRQLRKAAA